MVVRGAKEGPNDGFKHLAPLLSGIQSTVQHFFSQECGRKRTQPTPPLPSLSALHTGPISIQHGGVEHGHDHLYDTDR